MMQFTPFLQPKSEKRWELNDLKNVDTGNGEVAVRKISLTAQLSNPNDYEGCELIINNHATEVVGNKDRGSIQWWIYSNW